MKGDFSKDTFVEEKHFRDVLMQQGRVLLGSDWNEQVNITANRIETGTEDIIGQSGAPMHNAGFQIQPNGAPPTNISISAGRYYVDGILCENETANLLFANQPDFNGTVLPAAVGNYIFYLDVWLRHITALEDNSIKEVALGGPDTTTRTKTVWQVKYHGPVNSNCAELLPNTITDPSTGKLNARTEASIGSEGPCGIVTSGGYRRLENQLYRVEIHRAGATRAETTFKWSRDNGSMLAKWEGIDSGNPSKLIVSSTGRDEILGFRTGDWVELIDDRTDLLGLPGVFVKLTDVRENALFFDNTTIKDPEHPLITTVTFSNKNCRIRRWDSPGGEIALNTIDATWLSLEDGVEVNFAEGTFKCGDYWLIPARTATAAIEWPFTTAQAPRGIEHHYAKLGIMNLVAVAGAGLQWATVSDCRDIFPPLTELTSLYYVGGDGQEAMPGQILPDTLKVGVANGQWAVNGARVKFELVTAAGGLLDPTGVNATTVVVATRTISILGTNNEIAECSWRLGAFSGNLKLQVRASLLDDAGNIITGCLPVIFNAAFNVASNVLYDGTGCENWGSEPHTTVAEAITALCKRGSKKGCTVSVGAGGQFATLVEAFKNLRDEKSICICLLPGQDHGLDDEINNFTEAIKDTIKISGCGATIKMTGKIFQLNAIKIIFQGFRLEASNESARINLTGNDINIDHCKFLRLSQNRKTPLIILKGEVADGEKTPNININANHIFSALTLGIGPGFQGYIQNNRLQGDIILQYSEKFFRFSWEIVNDAGGAKRKAIEGQVGRLLSITHNNNAMHICGNHMRRIITNVSGSITKQNGSLTVIDTDIVIPGVFEQARNVTIGGYESLIVSENVIRKAGETSFPGTESSLLARWVSFTDNRFLEVENKEVVAFALGHKGVITQNMDALPDGNAVIDTLFSHGQKIITSRLIDVL